jgi:hypothetical protein
MYRLLRFDLNNDLAFPLTPKIVVLTAKYCKLNSKKPFPDQNFGRQTHYYKHKNVYFVTPNNH